MGFYPCPLKPSLVEWKRNNPTALVAARDCLETFLGGMETRNLEGRAQPEKALKPSLVEWKQWEWETRNDTRVRPLKPSLVEWKLEDQGKLNTAHLP